jgi:heme-degrading monooxygenase HmoA
MVMEIALIPVAAGKESTFESAASRALDEIFAQARGFVRGEVRRGVERVGTYALLLEWETVEDHTEGFVKSELFDRWVELTEGLIDGDPVVEHWDLLGI